MRWRTQSCCEPLRLRRARRRDHPALAALWWRAVADSHRFMDQARLSREHATLTRLYLPSCDVWMAQGAGAATGFIALQGHANVAGLFVDPERQGRGIGTALLDRVRGKGPLSLEVAAPNFAARAFYRRYGFAETARRHDPDLDEVLVQLHLPARGPASVESAARPVM